MLMIPSGSLVQMDVGRGVPFGITPREISWNDGGDVEIDKPRITCCLRYKAKNAKAPS